MKLQTKLFSYFFSISILIVGVGLLFYIQLKNLIEPLTPQSIPRSVEQLANTIDREELIYRIKYQQLLVEYNLEKYVFTNRILALQQYYMNNAIILQLLATAKSVDAVQSSVLENKYHVLSNEHAQIIKLMQSHAEDAAKKSLLDSIYLSSLQDFNSAITEFSLQPAADSDEVAVVTVKQAAKNSYTILQKSLNTTLIIFFDALLASLILVFVSTRAIVQPINLLRNNIERMSIEKMTVTLHPKLLQLKGEVGDLARSFSELFHKLRTATVLRDELFAEIQRHKETEKQLEETAERLNKSNLDLDQFAYAASHDLRSPLRAIENLVKWIEEDCYALLPETSRNNFDLIKKRMHRLDALIVGMLEYSRSGHVTQQLEQIDLNQLLSEITDYLAPPAHIKFKIDTLLPVIVVDKAKITQVFLNLIGNAIKYNDKPQGYINIGHGVIRDYYQFYVTDNGCGIDPQFHHKVFEIFQTLHPRDEIESSGIGLAIVKKIVEKAGGEIWLTSAVSEGTTFFFTWPIDAEDIDS